MKHRVALLVVLLVLPGISPGGEKRERPSSTQGAITTRVLDVNRFNIQITDRGNLVRSIPGDGGGVWWFADTVQAWVVYDHGPWIIGKMNGQPAMGNSYWGTSYVPGPITAGRPALEVHPEDSVRFHPYKITRSSGPSDPDVLQWPADLGAPTYANGKPLLLGDGLVWSVFNGADSTVIPYNWNVLQNFPHLPVEIQQSFYARRSARSDTSLLANTAFLEWTFINKGSALIESCYVALWTDLDIGLGPNPFGVDTVLQTGYCWDASPVDSFFCLPRAAGYTLLYGPRVPDASSTAIYRGRAVQGYRNLPLSSFWGIGTDHGPAEFPVGPNTIEEAWNLARGYDKSGQVIIDSVTKLPTHFPWSGDPLTGTGWIYKGYTQGEAGFMFFSGPFTLAPGDTQWAMLALLASASRDNAESIRAIRNNAARIRAMSYQEIVLPAPLAVAQTEDVPRSCALDQNFPNPFNPLTIIKYTIGGNRGWGIGISDVSLVVYDLLGREVAVLVNERKAPGTYEVQFDASALASGVYVYRLTAGSFVESRKMILLK